MRVPPRRLLFSGGGIRVISYLGVLQVLQEQKYLQHVKEFCGVSAGGLVALMLALGYKMSVIERFCFEYDWSNVRSVDPDGAFEFLETYGIDDGTNLEKLIHKILYHKGFGPNVTFLDLQSSGRVKKYRIWASDIQNIKPIEFSATATPNFSVTLALRASMCIPLYFIPVKHPDTHTMLVDGGVFDNYPISYFTDEEAKETLGIVFEFQTTPQEVNDFTGFISLITTGYYKPSYQSLLKKHRERTIVIPCAEFSSLNFEATVEERQMLAAIGRKAATKFLNSTENPPLRRNSI